MTDPPTPEPSPPGPGHLPPLGIGGPAPDFVLEGTTGDPADRRSYRLSDYAGHTVVLAFYPADHSPVCTVQLTSYSSEIARFAEVDAQVLAISPQSLEDHEAFAAANDGFGFPLLSDIEREAAKRYGVLGPLGFYRRSIFVIDSEGLLRWAHRATAGFTYRPVDELIAVVNGL